MIKRVRIHVFFPYLALKPPMIVKMINKMKQTSRNAPGYSLSSIVLLACVTKKNRLKAVQVFLKFSGNTGHEFKNASNENKSVFILDF